MGLVKCADCATEMSDAAASCPKCGWCPAPPAAHPPLPAPKKSGVFVKVVVGLLLVVGLSLGGVLAYYGGPEGLRAPFDERERVATSNAEFDKSQDLERRRARKGQILEISATVLACRQAELGRSILGRTHSHCEFLSLVPDGPTLAGNGEYALRFKLKFHGAILGTEYAQDLLLAFAESPGPPPRASILGDDSPTPCTECDGLVALFEPFVAEVRRDAAAKSQQAEALADEIQRATEAKDEATRTAKTNELAALIARWAAEAAETLKALKTQ